MTCPIARESGIVCAMPDSATEALAAATRAELARSGLHQATVAEALGMSRQALNARLRGRTHWTAVELQRLAFFLGVPLTTLLPSHREQVSA